MMDVFAEKFIYFLPLIEAALLVVVVSLIFYFEDLYVGYLKRHKVLGQIIIGVTYGLCVIFANEFGSINIGGPLINARDASPLCAGLLFGAPAGIIAGAIGGLERWFSVYWGAGMYTRIGCSVACVLAGALAGIFRNFVFHKKIPSAIAGLFLAIVSEVIHLLLVFITHLDDVRTAFIVVKQCTFPIVIATSASIFITLLIVNLYSDYFEYKKYGNERKKITIASGLQLRLLAVIILAIVVSVAFEELLLTNAAIDQSKSTITINLDDAYDVYIHTNGSLDQKGTLLRSNCHIGETGSIFLTDNNFEPISYIDNNLKMVFYDFVIEDKKSISPDKLFKATVNGYPSFCIYRDLYGVNGLSENKVVGFYPIAEAYYTTYMVLYISVFIYIIVFSLLFVLIYMLVNSLIVKNVERINNSLTKITNGDLNNVVDVRRYAEFDLLSNGVNTMVVALKKLINEAKTRIAEELKFAKKIQHAALPSVFPPYPDKKSFDIYASMITAKEVGGDFYDFYFIGRDKFVFLVADVSGKGIPAAMFMMQSKSIIKSFAESNIPVEEVMIKANNEICDNNEAEMFITTFLCLIDMKTGKVEYVNAGHNPPILTYDNGEAKYMDAKKNLVLAGMNGVQYKKGEFTMKKGDFIFMYTDGVTEAINKKEELYGEERLLKAANNNRLETMENLCNNIKQDLDAFVDGADQFDDITMLAFRYKGED